MENLSAALNTALEIALTGEAEQLTRDDLVRKSRADIEAAVFEALTSAEVLDAIRAPQLVHSLLCEMAAAGRRDMVVNALQRGADPNYCKDDLNTPLILATKATAMQCVHVLLLAKADIHARGADGRTALHHAAALADEATLLTLVDFGAMGSEELEQAVDQASSGSGGGGGRSSSSSSGSGSSCSGTGTGTGTDTMVPTPMVLLEREDMRAYTAHLEHYRQEYANRQRITARIRHYLAGTLPPHCTGASARHADLASLPDACREEGTGVLPSCYEARPWSETSHRFCPPTMREGLFMLLLASHRRREGDACCLPSELWRKIFSHMHRDWLDDPWRRAREEERARQEATLAVAVGGGDCSSGSSRAWELRGELQDLDDKIRMLSLAAVGDPVALGAVAGPLARWRQERQELRKELSELTGLALNELPSRT